MNRQYKRNKVLNNKQSALRIIAGRFRGRKITFPNVDIIRPTTNRLRETVFNWLTPYIENANCLDAFAGGGILGFEALSQGAKHITFVDQAVSHTKSIITNAETLKIQPAINAHCTDFFSLNINPEPFDIIFLDPPYHQGLVIKAINFIKNKKLAHQNTIIFVDGEKEIIPQLSKVLTILKQKTTKRILIALGKIAP